MKAVEYETYSDYVKARTAEGYQVLPKLLWRALKENKPELVTPKRVFPANT